MGMAFCENPLVLFCPGCIPFNISNGKGMALPFPMPFGEMEACSWVGMVAAFVDKLGATVWTAWIWGIWIFCFWFGVLGARRGGLLCRFWATLIRGYVIGGAAGDVGATGWGLKSTLGRTLSSSSMIVGVIVAGNGEEFSSNSSSDLERNWEMLSSLFPGLPEDNWWTYDSHISTTWLTIISQAR